MWIAWALACETIKVEEEITRFVLLHLCLQLEWKWPLPPQMANNKKLALKY